jgi:hypothetical protein
MHVHSAGVVLATIDDIRPYLEDKEACAHLFFHWRWPSGFRCRACGSEEATRISTRRYVWQCLRCRRQTTLTAGTALHASKVALQHWLYAIWMIGHRKQSISALQLQKELGIGSYETAWSLLHKVRALLVDHDETPLSRRVRVAMAELWTPTFRHHGTTGPRAPRGVTIAVERDPPRFARARVDDAFRDLNERAARVAGHSMKLPMASRWEPATTRICAVLLKNFKSWIEGTFHGVGLRYVGAYLAEFIFRFNRRHDEPVLATVLGRRVMRGPPTTRRALRDLFLLQPLPARGAPAP